METYKKDQKYILKVVNTDNEIKEIKYTPEKDMSKPEMIMALKSKYKNFFKLLENKNVKTEKLKVAWFEHRDYNDFRSDIIQGKLKDGRQFLSGDYDDVQVYKLGYNAIQKLNDKLKTDNENILEQIDIDMTNNEEDITMEDVDIINNQIYSKKDIKNEEYFICSRCLKGVDLDCNVEDYVIDPKTGEEMCRDCAIEAGIPVTESKSLDIEKLKKAMSVLGYEYDDIDSYDGYIKFQQTGVNLEAFNSWEDVADYLNYLVVDDEEQQREIDNILQETKSEKNKPVIVISYGRGMRFPDRKTAIDYYKECIAGTDPDGAENYSYQNILYSLMHTDKDVVYDTDDETEYDWWIQKGKPTDDVSDELLKAHLGENKIMKKEDLSDKDIKELDEYTETEIRKMYDKYCSENNDKKSFEEWQKENVDSALINELEYEFFSNRKKTEDLDIDDKVYEDGFVGQPLSMVLSYIGDGHDIADIDYDSVVFFPPVDEIDDTDNYDLYVQGLSQVLKVSEAFDLDDINIVVNISDYVKSNKDTLLDLFEVDGETDEEIMEDLVCRVMPSIISGYTTDSVYKLLLNTVKGGK